MLSAVSLASWMPVDPVMALASLLTPRMCTPSVHQEQWQAHVCGFVHVLQSQCTAA